jgi:hypothetical protein
MGSSPPAGFQASDGMNRPVLRSKALTTACTFGVGDRMNQ